MHLKCTCLQLCLTTLIPSHTLDLLKESFIVVGIGLLYYHFSKISCPILFGIDILIHSPLPLQKNQNRDLLEDHV